MRRVAISAALIVAITTAGCSGPSQGDPPPLASGSPSTSAASPSATPGPGGVTAPLTGRPTTPALAARPAMAVIVGVTPGAAVPAGLGAADLVYAEYAEGGLTRLIALFQSREAPTIGPVISTRPADPKLLGVFHGCVAFAGGTSGFVKQFAPLGVCELNIEGQAYTSTARLYAAAERGHTAPTPPSSFAGPGQPLAVSGLANATRLIVTVPGRSSQTWAYDPKATVWRSSIGGVAMAVTTVEVLTMPYRAITVHSPLRTLPSASVVGVGGATVVSGPHAANGSWYRPSAKGLANIVDASKLLMHPLAGSTWVILAPTGTRVEIR
ncbi:MAG: DUF3048 domain-containing protein [Actinomycetota bacterium]|nr:DUF3048 domain-containing protein [Actinomycetota bacterium]